MLREYEAGKMPKLKHRFRGWRSGMVVNVSRFASLPGVCWFGSQVHTYTLLIKPCFGGVPHTK